MEAAMKEAGTCGRFQAYHVIFTQLPRFVSVWGSMIMMYGSYDPGWRCTAGGRYGDLTLMEHSGNDSMWNKTSQNFVTEYDNKANGHETINLNETITRLHAAFYNETCDVMTLCDDVEFNPASVTIVTEFMLVCDRKWILRAILWVMSAGFLTGALLGGQIGERFGRKISLYGGCLISSIFSGLAIFSTHWAMYMVCLFFVGTGTHFILSTSAIFSMEFLNSKWRSMIGSIPTWNLAMCCLTLAIALMKSWIYLHLATCLISLIACVGFIILPESIRWLSVHGKIDKSEEVIKRVARMNKRPTLMPETLVKLREEADNAYIIQTSKSSSNYPLTPSAPSSSVSSPIKTYTVFHLFKTKTLFVLTLKFTVIFFITYTTYYALGFGVDSLPGDFYVNAIASSFCEIFLVVITGPMCNSIGRRWGGFVVSAVGVVSCCGFVISLYAFDGEVKSTLMKSCAFIARSSAIAMYHVVTVFMSELYPTAVRNVAFGFLTGTSGLGGLVAPFLVPYQGRESFTVCFSVMSCCFLVSLVIFLSLPETNKLCLVDNTEHTVTTSKPEKNGQSV